MDANYYTPLISLTKVYKTGILLNGMHIQFSAYVHFYRNKNLRNSRFKDKRNLGELS